MPAELLIDDPLTYLSFAKSASHHSTLKRRVGIDVFETETILSQLKGSGRVVAVKAFKENQHANQ